MKMDCVDINLLTHSQQVPVHPFALEHGQPRQVGIEPPIDGCAVNNMQRAEKAVTEVLKMLNHLRENMRDKLDAAKLIQNQSISS